MEKKILKLQQHKINSIKCNNFPIPIRTYLQVCCRFFRILVTYTEKKISKTSNLYVAARTELEKRNNKKNAVEWREVNIAQGDHYLRDIFKNYCVSLQQIYFSLLLIPFPCFFPSALCIWFTFVLFFAQFMFITSQQRT